MTGIRSGYFDNIRCASKNLFSKKRKLEDLDLSNLGYINQKYVDEFCDIIGILNGRQSDQQGFVFAVRSQEILATLQEYRKTQKKNRINPPTLSRMAGVDRTQQVKRLQDYVYLVKVH